MHSLSTNGHLDHFRPFIAISRKQGEKVKVSSISRLQLAASQLKPSIDEEKKYASWGIGLCHLL